MIELTLDESAKNRLFHDTVYVPYRRENERLCSGKKTRIFKQDKLPSYKLGKGKSSVASHQLVKYPRSIYNTESTALSGCFHNLWLIHTAGSGLGSLLGLGFLYYAEISHWFGSRLWSPDWNVWNRDGHLSPGWISVPKMGTVTIR